MKIVFLGDSITDAYKNRNAPTLSERYGSGYVMLVAGELLKRDYDRYQIVNSGIGGNRSEDLVERMRTDVLDHHPDVLNILVGVNDVWHGITDPSKGISPDRYEQNLRTIIETVWKENPDCRMILCEPFFLPGKHTSAHMEAFAELRNYVERVKKLAAEYRIPFLPLQETLNRYAAEYSPAEVLGDGVHPNILGATVIAREWLALFDSLGIS